MNSEYPHFGLSRVNGNKVLFISSILDRKGRPKKIQGLPLLTVYQGELTEDGGLENISQIPIDPKQNIFNITSAAMSSDGEKLYISSRYNYKNKPKGTFNMENFHISVGEFKPGLGWTNFKALPFCKLRYSYAQPALSRDGKTLYFIANIRGGKETTKGGSDIFKVDVLANGKYGELKNLGKNVNSYGKEMFPVLTSDNTLYFSSNRTKGYGGFDIYKSVLGEDGKFSKAEKLSKPLNSVKDDFSFFTTNGGASGYFVSKRPKGKGDDDIYYFIMD